MKNYISLADRFGEQEYTVNSVRYIVGSCFQTTKIVDNPSIAEPSWVVPVLSPWQHGSLGLGDP